MRADFKGRRKVVQTEDTVWAKGLSVDCPLRDREETNGPAAGRASGRVREEDGSVTRWVA